MYHFMFWICTYEMQRVEHNIFKLVEYVYIFKELTLHCADISKVDGDDEILNEKLLVTV